jgi:hypothetical protein
METDIHAALMARVESLTLTPAPTIVWPGFPADQAAYWLRVTHLPNVPERGTLDGTVDLDRQGILQLDLMNEMGRHEVVYIDRAQDIIAHFPQRLRLTSGGAMVRIVKAYALGGRATGDHWMTPVRVEYRAEAA